MTEFLLVVLLLATVVVAAYFYLKRRQQHVHVDAAGTVEHRHAQNPDEPADHDHDLETTTDPARRD